MPTCFVIQPFDSGKYDKRYEDIYKVAIEAAGVDSYRVDRDHSVAIPIEAIETGIRTASACLADITEDNPNVWFELGFALALGKPVVMLCSEERTGRYPFDIQHRSVVRYKSESTRDFEALRTTLTDRIKASLEKGEGLRQLAETDQVAPVAGLTQPELFVLAVLAGSVGFHDGIARLMGVKRDAERAGLTSIGFALGMRRLTEKGLVRVEQEEDHDGDLFTGASVTPNGWSWIDANESKFLIRKPSTKSTDELDDDIPF